LIKTRLISLVLIASLFAYSLAWLGIVKGFGMCDGGGFM
jgi:hypothetical protein